jgi:hypothetical protein
MRIPGMALVGLLVLALGGCGAGPRPGRVTASTPAAGSTSGAAGDGAGTATGTPPAPGATAGVNPTRRSPDVLVTYGRQGGIAGLDDRLSVRTDGAYERTRRGAAVTKSRLTADELTRLRSVLAESRFTEIPAVNTAPGVSDAFTYRIGYGDREVTAQDGAVPAALRPVIDALDAIVSRA